MSSKKGEGEREVSDDTKNRRLLFGSGFPAFMSQKEPGLRLLRERYFETFALTRSDKPSQIHLFLIKVGLWSLVWTFTPRDVTSLASDKIEIANVLSFLENALSGDNTQFLQRLDTSVIRAKERIKNKIDEFS